MAPYTHTDAIEYAPLATRGAITESQHAQLEPRRRSFWERIGLISVLILFVGSLVLVLPVLPLAWIWQESMTATSGKEPSALWIKVLKANWTTKIVTICTAVIRTAMAAQASLVTAMLAGVVLERVGTPVIDGPFWSMIRAISVAPINLLLSPNLRTKGYLSFFVYMLISIEALVTIASQFLSTLLIFDFKNSTFTDTNNSTSIRILDEYPLRISSTWWSMAPASSWTYAELSDSFVEGINFHDTGHTYQAFLPLEEELQRARLRHFRGPAPVMDQRVVCAKPSLINLTLDLVNPYFARLSGQIAFDNRSYPMLQYTEGQPHLPFRCALPAITTLLNSTHGETSFCWPNGGAGWQVLLRDPLVKPMLIEKEGAYIAGYPKASTMFMILDLVSTAKLRTGTGATHAVNVVRNDGPWAMIGNTSDTEALRVTACTTNLGVETLSIDMHSHWEGLEPRMSWNRQAERYNTESIRRQLGASLESESFNLRGVLVLNPKSQWQSLTPQNEPSDNVSTPAGRWIFTQAIANSLRDPQATVYSNISTSANPGVIMSRRSSFVHFNLHESLLSLFQDTLQATGSPALATRALLTRVCQMVYYEKLVSLDISASASTSFSIPAFIPTQWTGFAVAMALIGIHLIVMVVVTGLFWKHTCSSLIGNYWQAVSQVFSKDTITILEEADRMNDKEVKHWIKENSVELSGYNILRHRANGRIVLTMEGEEDT
ncbi:hypothetical protein BDV40DRAFT_313924 [Aspergillus tamarii]|uniref:Uncharacterized protein n=1 Tax=Aspergillus tamarii TaxID=41984 RepID=A0A5N6UP29_ASPTM|nr:hypothetical protein BDV40DRAFT_313924 [Aspergillus tamarii]